MGTAVRTLALALDSPAEIPHHSRVDGPIDRLSVLRRSLLFAELSNVAYFPRCDAGRLAYQIGLPEIRFYDRDGAQAYIFGNCHDVVVVCRGTEPDDWNDLRASVNMFTVLSESVGRVHRGFKREVDDLWPRLEQALVNNTRTLWFTGHSLGGAMAAICAGRCSLSHIRSNPRALYTFGSPRIGSRRYVNYVRLEAYRWVNNNDIICRLPPALLGYRHKGHKVYLNAYGQVRRMTAWQRTKDRWRGFLQGLREGSWDHLADHRIGRYIEHIWRAIQHEEHISTRLRMPMSSELSRRRRAA